MYLLELIQEALRNLRRHKLRSLLTTLGIVFGVASVISMVSIGEGAKQAILEQIQQLGITNVIVNARKPPEESDVQDEEQSNVLAYGLTFRDADQIRETLPMVEEVLPVHDAERWVWFGSRRIAARVRGVTPDYFELLKLKPFLGRPLNDADVAGRRRSCVIHRGLLKEARYVGDPLKLKLKVGSEYFQVVGVLPELSLHGANRSVLGVAEGKTEIYVPFETIMDRFGDVNVSSSSGVSERTQVELNQIVCKVSDEERIVPAARCIERLLDALHNKQDYEIIVPLELLQSQQKAQRVFNIVLPIIAGISLLVGGIGVLNIMLASITERTREIGVRRAIGASESDITVQFLVETVSLAMIGGLIGIVVGIGGVFVLEYMTQWRVVITPWALLLALAMSCLTGVVFGIYPARRAAAMHPVKALRHS